MAGTVSTGEASVGPARTGAGMGGRSAMAGLRLATWPAHQRLEKRIDVKARFATIAAYRAHLCGMWGFCAALEERLDPGCFVSVLDDYPARRKLPMLTQDLTDLGMSAAEVSALPRCTALADCRDTATAFGRVYVFEGATLGGRTLLPLVETRLGLSANHGAAFLASYGASVGAMWQRFGAALDGFCTDDRLRSRAEAGATDTFSALEDWLCGAPS